MQRCIGDVRDVGQRLERLTGSLAVPQIDRQELDLPVARQLGFATRDADYLPARGQELLDRGHPSRPLAPVTNTLFDMTTSVAW